MTATMFVTKTMPAVTSPAENSVVLTPTETGLDVTLLPCGVPVREIRLTWEFDMTAYTKILADSWGVALGNLGWKDRAEVTRAEWYFALTDGSAAHCFGVRTGCAAFCSWLIEENRLTLVCDVRSGGEGIELTAPLLCATVVSMESSGNETVYAASKRFCRLMCEKPRLAGHPVYGFNTWYYTYGDITRASVMKDAELCALLASGTPAGSPLPYMVIDDGWSKTRIPNVYNGGPFLPNEDFGDMKAVAEDIAAKGCAPGIWIRALYVLPEMCPQIPETCYSENQQYVSGKPGKILDPTTDGAKEYIFNLVRGLSDSGYRLIKHDFTCPDYMGNKFLSPSLTVDGWHPHDRTKTNAQILMDLYSLIQEAANGAVVIGCNTYNHLAAGIHELQRSGCDTSGRNWETTKTFGINSLVYRLCQNNSFFETDADCACFTQYVPTDKNILFADVISRCNSALFVSAAPDILKPNDIDKLIEIYRRSAMAKTQAEPLDWMDKTTPEEFLWEGKTIKYNWD